MKALPPVFAVSTGRCGSTLLSDMLNLHPQVLSLSEFFGLLLTGPFPAGELTAGDYWSLLSTPHSFVTSAYRVGAPIEEFRYEPGPGRRFDASTGIPPLAVTTLPHLTDDPDALYSAVEAFLSDGAPAPVEVWHRRLFDWLRSERGARVWVERSGFSLRHVPELLRLFPDARFMHLYRDGRECAYSMSRSGAFRLGAVSMRLQQALGFNPFAQDVPSSVTVPAELRPLMPDTFDLAAFEAVELPAEEFGAIWSDQVLSGLSAMSPLGPDRLLQFSYEELVGDVHGTLTRLADFIGPLSDLSPWLAKAAGLVTQRPSGWRSLPEDQRNRLESACRPAMERLYDTA